MAMDVCPKCGMKRENWSGDGGGFNREGDVYCCQGCSEGTGCTCRP